MLMNANQRSSASPQNQIESSKSGLDLEKKQNFKSKKVLKFFFISSQVMNWT